MIFYFHCFGKPDVRNAWTEKLSTGTSRFMTSSNNSAGAPASYGTCPQDTSLCVFCVFYFYSFEGSIDCLLLSIVTEICSFVCLLSAHVRNRLHKLHGLCLKTHDDVCCNLN